MLPMLQNHLLRCQGENMLRIVTSILFSYVIIGGMLAYSQSFTADQYAGGTPTAPQPPMASKTSLPPTNTHQPPQRPTNTPTRFVPPTRQISKTPRSTLAPVVTETQTPSISSTITPTLTPTPFLNLRIVVYLDLNKDNILEYGEGVNDLLLLITAGSWKGQIILHDGEAWLALPPGLPSGTDVQVQSPYLHWSRILIAPKPGEIVEASLHLDLPQYPVSLL